MKKEEDFPTCSKYKLNYICKIYRTADCICNMPYVLEKHRNSVLIFYKTSFMSKSYFYYSQKCYYETSKRILVNLLKPLYIPFMNIFFLFFYF